MTASGSSLAEASPLAIGVDGAPGGWVAARIHENDRVDITFHEAFIDIVTNLSPHDVIIVDMPIGLSANGHRPVDSAVRERLGVRRSTFFPTPLRSVLDFDDWADANEHSKAVSGRGLSKQAWNLVPKIAEVDDAWTTALRDRLREGHPETSFAEMAGAPLQTKKSQADGRTERISLLAEQLSPTIETVIDECPKKWSIDAIDALALAWTAQRVRSGEAIRLGGELDDCGRPMELTI